MLLLSSTDYYQNQEQNSVCPDLGPSCLQRLSAQVRIQRGGGGQGVRTPPGKPQVIWVSIGNKQLEPPLEKVGPPPWKILDPLWNLEK